MFLSQLTLANFRTYRRLTLRLSPGVTVFQGENGQGKTNLLEAVYYLATTRSPRATSDRELIAWPADGARAAATPATLAGYARLEARVQKQGGELHVLVLLREEAAPGTPPGVAKVLKVNGLPARAADLVGQVNVVLFSPEDVALVSGPPAGRRRYLDIVGSQVSHPYLRALQRYNRVLSQRNHLLRQIRERRQPRELLEFWSDELAEAGTVIVRHRLEMIAAMNRVLGQVYRALSGTDEPLRLTYSATAARTPSEEALAFRERLAELEAREIEQGVTLIGPHRDDFTCLVGEIDVGTYGSRGQQRLAVLALKLAEADYMRAQTGEAPILLLDDLLSELDAPRRQYVLARIAGVGQSLITTTDLSAFSEAFLSRAEVYQVHRGRLVPAPVLSRSAGSAGTGDGHANDQ